VVNGLIKAENIVVSGVLDGKVTCKSIDILSTGKVMGEVICSALMIEAGGKFIGESRELTDGAMIVSIAESERLADSRVAKLVEAKIDEAPEEFKNKKANGTN
jgi:cytoskeletal protein CcmA (bactofilin family)